MRSIIALSFLIIATVDSNSVVELNSKAVVSGYCSSNNEISFESVPSFKEGQTTTKSSIMDGRYYETVFEFSDGFRGRLFQGGNSGRYFIEDPSGTNFYYMDKDSAVRALYIYKKYECISRKYTN